MINLNRQEHGNSNTETNQHSRIVYANHGQLHRRDQALLCMGVLKISKVGAWRGRE